MHDNVDWTESVQPGHVVRSYRCSTNANNTISGVISSFVTVQVTEHLDCASAQPPLNRYSPVRPRTSAVQHLVQEHTEASRAFVEP